MIPNNSTHLISVKSPIMAGAMLSAWYPLTDASDTKPARINWWSVSGLPKRRLTAQAPAPALAALDPIPLPRGNPCSHKNLDYGGCQGVLLGLVQIQQRNNMRMSVSRRMSLSKLQSRRGQQTRDIMTLCKTNSTPQDTSPIICIASSAAIPAQFFLGSRERTPSSPVILDMTTSPFLSGSTLAVTTSPSP